MQPLTQAAPTGTRASDRPLMPAYSPVTAGRALAGGVLGGGVVVALTAVVEQAGISGPGWSLSGNGAIAILVAGAAAVLGGGWAAIATRFTSAGPRRLAVCLIACLTSLLATAVLLFAFLLPTPLQLLGESGAAAVVLAAAVGFALPRVARVQRSASIRLEAAVLLLAIAIVVGPAVLRGSFVWLAVPLLVNLPLLTIAGRAFGRGWLIGACLAMFVGLLLTVLALMIVIGIG